MASKSKSRYMKTGNIADNRVGLAPNPEEKPKAVKKTLTKKATKPVSPKQPASPKKPSPPKNKPTPTKPATKAPKKASLKKEQPNNALFKTNIAPSKTSNKNAPKYRFNSPSNSVLTANNFEDLFRLEGKGESREEFKRQMK